MQCTCIHVTFYLAPQRAEDRRLVAERGEPDPPRRRRVPNVAAGAAVAAGVRARRHRGKLLDLDGVVAAAAAAASAAAIAAGSSLWRQLQQCGDPQFQLRLPADVDGAVLCREVV